MRLHGTLLMKHNLKLPQRTDHKLAKAWSERGSVVRFGKDQSLFDIIFFGKGHTRTRLQRSWAAVDICIEALPGCKHACRATVRLKRYTL